MPPRSGSDWATSCDRLQESHVDQNVEQVRRNEITGLGEPQREEIGCSPHDPSCGGRHEGPAAKLGHER